MNIATEHSAPAVSAAARRVWRIEVRPTDPTDDPFGANVLHGATEGRLAAALSDVRSARVFLIEADLDEAVVQRIADDLLADPVNQTAALGTGPGPDDGQVVEVHYLPGVMDPVADSMQLLMGQGAFGFAPQPVIEPSIGAFDVALADFDGDAYPDLVLSGGAGGVAALVNDGATLDEAALIGTGWSLEMGTTADLDGDGRDELIAMLADGDLMVATNLGDATFDAPVRYGVPVPGLYATAAALTAAGAADVVVCAMDGLSVLINDGTGGLDDSAFLAADVGGSCRATPVDLDGDGHRELLVSAPAQLGWYLLRTCVP